MNALVSGGASGLGGATVRELVARGAQAAIFDRDADKAQALAQELGERQAAFEGDVTDEAPVAAAVDGAVEAFGELRFVVGCAGIGWAEKTVGKQGAANLQPFETVDPGEPDRDVQRAPAGRRRDERRTSPTRTASAAAS